MKSINNKTNFGIFFLMLITISFSFNSFIYSKEINYIFQFINDGYSSPNENLIEGNLDILNEKWSDVNSLTLQGMKFFYDLGSNMRTYLVRRLGILDFYYNNRQIKTLNFERKNSILASYLLLVGLFPPLSSEKMRSDQVKFSESSYDYYKSDELYEKLSLNALPNGIEVYPIKAFHPDNKIYGLSNPRKCPGVEKFIEYNRKNQKSTLRLLDKFASLYKNELNLLNWHFNKENSHEKLMKICSAYTKGYLDNRKFKIFDDFFLDKKKLFNDCNELENNYIYEVILGDKKNLVGRLSNTRFLKNLFDFMDKKIESVIFKQNLEYYLENFKEKNFAVNAPYDKEFEKYAKNKQEEEKAKAINSNKEEMMEKYSLFSGSKMDMGSFVSFLHYTFNTMKLPIEESSTIFFELVLDKTIYDLHKDPKKRNNLAKKKFFDENDFEVYIFFNRKKILELNYKKFKNLSKANFIAEDFIDDFCRFESDDSLIFLIISILLFVICLIMLVWVIKLWINYNRRNMKKRLLSEEDQYEEEEEEESESHNEMHQRIRNMRNKLDREN